MTNTGKGFSPNRGIIIVHYSSLHAAHANITAVYCVLKIYCLMLVLLYFRFWIVKTQRLLLQ